MKNKEIKTDKDEHISISVGQMGIYVACFAAGLTVASALNWGGHFLQLQSLKDDYQKLESEYNSLKQDYDSISKGIYRAEYTLHQGETIIDDTVGCTLKVEHIHSVLGKIDGDLFNPNKTDEDGEHFYIDEAVPYDVFGEGKFSLILKETTEDDCTIVFTEITTEQIDGN